MKEDLNIENTLPLKTARLLIDRFVPDDWKDYFEIEISHEQHQFNHETYCPKSETQVKDFIHKMSEQRYDKRKLPMLFAIRKKDRTKMIGFIGLKKGELKKNCSVEVYYSINRDYWNSGYCTEALKRIIKFGFQTIGLHRIFAGCDIENVASKRVMEKAGMRYESRWRQDRIRNGKWTDGLGFAIVEEDLLVDKKV